MMIAPLGDRHKTRIIQATGRGGDVFLAMQFDND
jgi:hypothetical protein